MFAEGLRQDCRFKNKAYNWIKSKKDVELNIVSPDDSTVTWQQRKTY